MTRGHAPYLTDDEREKRRQVRLTMRKAIRNGSLVRGGCEAIGPHRGRISGHHSLGYDEPLAVIWLCAMHHGMQHNAMNHERAMAAYGRDTREGHTA